MSRRPIADGADGPGLSGWSISLIDRTGVTDSENRYVHLDLQ